LYVTVRGGDSLRATESCRFHSLRIGFPIFACESKKREIRISSQGSGSNSCLVRSLIVPVHVQATTYSRLDETLQDANEAHHHYLMHPMRPCDVMEGTLFSPLLQLKRVLEKFHACVAPQAPTQGEKRLIFCLLGLEERNRKEACAGMDSDKQMGLGEINADATPSTGTCRAKIGCKKRVKSGTDIAASKVNLSNTKDRVKIGWSYI
jgi:hypothetical protein